VKNPSGGKHYESRRNRGPTVAWKGKEEERRKRRQGNWRGGKKGCGGREINLDDNPSKLKLYLRSLS